MNRPRTHKKPKPARAVAVGRMPWLLGTLVLAAMATPRLASAEAAPLASMAQPPTLPLFFEAGAESSNGKAQALARGHDYQFLISPSEMRFQLLKRERSMQDIVAGRYPAIDRARVRAGRMEFVGANPKATLLGQEELPGKINYLVGNDPKLWRSSVPVYGKVSVRQLYPGIDLVYYGNPEQLEYDFAVAAGTNPGLIAWRYEGVDRVALGTEGELIIKLGDGEIRQPRPHLYQEIAGVRREVQGAYQLKGELTVGFHIGKYDPHHALIIDPVFSYSTYFGGNRGDAAYAVKVDSGGSVYLAGATLSTQLSPVPSTNVFQSAFRGGGLTGDAFVAKFDNTGSRLVYFTYLGGSSDDAAYDLALDSSGNAYLTGFTDSADFPTRNALYAFIHGTPDFTLNVYPNDAFVAELNTNGSALVFSTYLGGNEDDAGSGIAVDAAGYIYVTGYTDSTNFPYAGGYQNWYAGNDDVFVTKLAPGGTRLVYSTFLGGYSSDRGEGIAVDDQGAAYVTGHTYSTNFPYAHGYQNWHGGGADAFVTKFNANGTLGYSTYLGGGFDDFGYRIAVDSRRNAWVTGTSLSSEFPHKNSIAGLTSGNNGTNSLNYDAFLCSFDTNGGLAFSSLFGGARDDAGWDLAIDPSGRIFIIGTTISTNFPVTNVFGLFRTNSAGGRDVFVVALETNATAALYAGYLGGSMDDFGYGIAVDAEGSAYVVGLTDSTNFPVASPYQALRNGPNDAFVAKIRLMDPALRAQLSGNAFLLSWPVTAPDYHLESAANLVPPVTWTPVPYAPTLVQGSYTVTLGFTNNLQAFRLAR